MKKQRENETKKGFEKIFEKVSFSKDNKLLKTEEILYRCFYL